MDLFRWVLWELMSLIDQLSAGNPVLAVVVGSAIGLLVRLIFRGITDVRP